jgi:hypothetical protein
LVERAAQRDVQQLDTAADSKHWLTVGDRAPCQRQLDLVAQRLDSPKAGMWCLAEVCGLYVAAAREQQTIATAIVCVQNGLIACQVKQQWNAAGGLDRQ